MLDKSCFVEEQMVSSDGLNFLQKCFPSVDKSDLQEVLMRCEGDSQWATNILLDSALEYNEPAGVTASEEPVKQIICTPSVDSSITSKELSSPPPLAVLCHSFLPIGTQLSSNNMQQTFVHGSVRRLKSIEEFKRQHSTSIELRDGDMGMEGTGAGRTTDLSIVNPCSPGGTLKDDVFETLFRQNSRPTSAPVGKKTLNMIPPQEEDSSRGHAKQSDSPAGQDEIDGQSLEPSVPSAVDIDEVIEEELKEATTEVGVSLELPNALAKQLIRMFGPVAFHISPGKFMYIYFTSYRVVLKCLLRIMGVFYL